MKSILGRLLALSGIRVSRIAVSVALGAATILFGVGLIATAGYRSTEDKNAHLAKVRFNPKDVIEHV